MERHTENLQPELEHHAIDGTAGGEMQSLENGQPGGEPNGEGWIDDVKRCGEGELQPRQQKGESVHRQTASVAARGSTHSKSSRSCSDRLCDGQLPLLAQIFCSPSTAAV